MGHFYQKSCDMTSLKRNLLKNSPRNLLKCCARMPNWCPVSSVIFPSISALVFKLLAKITRGGVICPPPLPSKGGLKCRSGAAPMGDAVPQPLSCAVQHLSGVYPRESDVWNRSILVRNKAAGQDGRVVWGPGLPNRDRAGWRCKIPLAAVSCYSAAVAESTNLSLPRWIWA